MRGHRDRPVDHGTMKLVERYLTLGGSGEASYRELASKFIGIAFPIQDEVEFKQALDGIMRDHPSSRHFCFGWVVGDGGERYRANDDGEPSGTAGKPILRQLQGAGLTYSAVVVVRYFGGTLLGKPGLIHAYGEATRLALGTAPIVERILMERCLITCGYDRFDQVRNDVHQVGGRIVAQAFTEQCSATLELPVGTTAALTSKWELGGIQVRPQ
jgi:uncharacterized YigZ family protein